MDEKNEEVFTNNNTYLMDSLIRNDQLDQAWQIYSALIAKDADFSLNALKQLRLATCLLKNGRTAELSEVLDRLKMPEKPDDSTKGAIWREAKLLIKTAADLGNKELTDKLIHSLRDSRFANINSTILSPCVQYYLDK